jgi:hypothetical protein
MAAVVLLIVPYAIAQVVVLGAIYDAMSHAASDGLMAMA